MRTRAPSPTYWDTVATSISARSNERSTWFTPAAMSARESISVPSRSKATCRYTTSRMARRSLRGERRPAAAGVRGLRVGELEAAAVQAADEVDLGPAEVLRADRVDEHANAVVLEDLVALARRVVEVEL